MKRRPLNMRWAWLWPAALAVLLAILLSGCTTALLTVRIGGDYYGCCGKECPCTTEP